MNDSKICIVTARNIYDSPCLEKYERLISQPCDIVYWDRHDIEEECFAVKKYKYTGVVKASESKMKKFLHYIQFSRYVKRIILKNKYDCLVIFPSHTAWLILGLLVKQYKKRYLLDIRDYSGENNPLIYFMTKTAIRNSGLCTITSKAFERFLPKHEYIVSHNIQKIDSSLIQSYRYRKRDEHRPIVLAFIGTVRFIDQQKLIIQQFKNDSRFILKYIGRGSEQLKDYCENNNISNVVLKGRFERKELSTLYLDTDMAINMYGYNDPFLDYALSNKLYSAALMGMPILCSPHTYMAEVSERYNFGCSVDLNDSSCSDKVYEFYTGISKEKLFKGCDDFIRNVYKDEEVYSTHIREFIDRFG